MARAVNDVDDFDDDEDALRWAGDDESGRAAPRLGGTTPVVEVQKAGGTAEEPGSRGRRGATVAFAVPYLAITVGWIFSVQQLSSGSGSLFTEILWQFGEFLAMLAAPLWFAATLQLTRDKRPLVRVGWLALGLGLLLPWPILLRFLAALQFAGGLS